MEKLTPAKDICGSLKQPKIAQNSEVQKEPEKVNRRGVLSHRKTENMGKPPLKLIKKN